MGNDLLTDDAVGLRVAHEVRQRLVGDPRIEVKETAEMGLALLDLIVDRDSLIVVDSIQTGDQPPGHVHELEPEHFPEHAMRSPHALGVDKLCKLGRMRGLSAPTHVRLIAIEVQDPFTLGTEMTPEVQDAIDDAADLVVQRALEFAQLPAEEHAHGEAR
ncbi:MAG TPA: hydrogenase maturation protease [Opitutaceae bacterium]|nr:hydrogenase maturation protease [Opitutaceae bacterium]